MRSINSYKLKSKIIKSLRIFFIVLGIFFFSLLILSFTDIPYYAYYNLGMSNSKLETKPDLIVILGGAGMPSPDGLMRTYYGSEEALNYPESKIIIALPKNEGNDSLYQLNLMSHELILKGIDSSRITYEPAGFNTRSQALNIAKKFGNKTGHLSVLLITSPEHMYRAVKTFQKAGFNKVAGTCTFETPPEEEMIKDKQNAPDKRVKSLDLRYNMWSYLHYELSVMREYCAIAYYKIKGWI
jgi:uncharacterized SAM-binding protein YcdF (DUF218 family)